jgi:pimeloyl-ACP methyl ester carboxylesterase
VSAFADGTAPHGEVTLAVRDYGGHGPDLLFIPGAGQTLADCGVLAPHLVGHHRVVAMDLRGHGYSSDGPFTWEAALDDVDAVISALGLERPAVVGHSLGGMIAALHGARHPDALGVVNLDGQGQGRPHQYDGVPEAVVVERLDALRALTEQQLAAVPHDPRVGEAMSQAMAAHLRELYGLDDDLVQDVMDRAFVNVEEGCVPRVSLETTRQILDEVATLDLPSSYRACRAPLLVYNAVAASPLVEGQGPPWLAEHSAAYRRGLARELAALAQELPRVEYVEVNATHMLHYEQPALVATQVVEFLAG